MTFTATPIGRFNKRVDLQRLKDQPDKSETGEIIRSYETYATVWAKFHTLSGNERLIAEQIEAIQTHEVTIRYRNDVLPDHRIKMVERIFDIKDIRNVDEANIELRMRCNEAVR